LKVLQNQFKVFAPIDIGDSIKKSNENASEKSWFLRGYATTPDLDLQDDIVDPLGIEITHFKEQGYINYEHQQGDEFIIGVPTENSYVDDKVGLYVEAKLYKSNPYAKAIWNLAQNIAESGIERKLGFSIEGFAKQRDKSDPRIIKSTYITNVAVTTSPANPNATWDAFFKSFVTGHAITPDTQVDAGALRAESFARSLHNLSSAYSLIDNPDEFNKLWKEVGAHLDTMGRSTDEAAVMFLQVSKGLSREQAIYTLDKFRQNTKS
jgi:Caudovirus prohead serine protease